MTRISSGNSENLKSNNFDTKFTIYLNCNWYLNIFKALESLNKAHIMIAITLIILSSKI